MTIRIRALNNSTITSILLYRNSCSSEIVVASLVHHIQVGAVGGSTPWRPVARVTPLVFSSALFWPFFSLRIVLTYREIYSLVFTSSSRIFHRIGPTLHKFVNKRGLLLNLIRDLYSRYILVSVHHIWSHIRKRSEYWASTAFSNMSFTHIYFL